MVASFNRGCYSEEKIDMSGDSAPSQPDRTSQKFSATEIRDSRNLV